MTRKVAFYGVFITLALVAGYIEQLVPIHFAVPGVKLGLANLVIIIVLETMGIRDAFIISMIRIVLSGLLFGNMFAVVYSLAGGIASLGIMAILKKTGLFSMISISVCGGIFHNIGQIIVAIIVLENTGMIYYLPVLLVSGVIAGVLIGILGYQVSKRLPGMDGN